MQIVLDVIKLSNFFISAQLIRIDNKCKPFRNVAKTESKFLIIMTLKILFIIIIFYDMLTLFYYYKVNLF